MKILLIKLNHLGDTLLLTPTVRRLREEYPKARIDVMCRSGCEVMLRNNPDIDHVIPVGRPEKEGRSFATGVREFIHAFRTVGLTCYDYAFDLADSDRAKFWIALSLSRVRGINVAYHRSWRHRLFFNRFSRYEWRGLHQVLRDWGTIREMLGLEGDAGPLVFFSDSDEEALKVKLPILHADEKIAVIHATSRWGFKQWIPERWAAVADRLAERDGLTVFFSCGPGESERMQVEEILSIAKRKHFSSEGSLTLHELAAILQRARIFLGVDTVAMHLAAAMQTPSVALFGPSSEKSWYPWRNRHELVLGECPCKRTRKFVCSKEKAYPCIDRILVDDVYAAAERLLARPEERAVEG